MDEILLNIESKQRRCAHLRHGVLYDLIVERMRDRLLAGNIYYGRVTNILENIQSAFIDIDEGDNGFIHVSDIVENRKKFEQIFEMDFELESEASDPQANGGEKEIGIENILKIGQPVLVQVVKEPIGSKGARLTSNLSIAGRFLVLLPNSNHRGVSKKIEDRLVRDRLKRLIRAFELPQDMGLICRTVSQSATDEELIDEAHELIASWHAIMESFEKANKPQLLHAESDLVKKAVMTAIDKGYQRILVDDLTTYEHCKRLLSKFGKSNELTVDFYRDKVPMFERFNIEREIERALKRKLWLNSGGYLYIDKTEAMHTIDVNSGRSSVNKADVEEVIVRINLEAAEEIARQLRIRNLGGLIVCDFIDMRQRKNQRRVLDKLRECMRTDSAKCTILGMSEFGLIEMTRQRLRQSLIQTMFEPCPYCNGNGHIKSHESVAIELERKIRQLIQCYEQYGIRLVIHPELGYYLDRQDRAYLKNLAQSMNALLEFEEDDKLHLNEYQFISITNNLPLEV
ncbi:MAG: ribonuclease E/G [Chlamydiia bacterium]|nr:ribonuclease E/G [Chlamydiia bacterium]